MDEWIEYKCKSGQTLFIYNKLTGEHKWLTGDGNGSLEESILNGEPIKRKEVCSIGTQTDDNGCNNGCTSMYADVIPDQISHATDLPPQPQPIVLYRREDSFGNPSGGESRFVQVEREGRSVNNSSSGIRSSSEAVFTNERHQSTTISETAYNAEIDENEHGYYVVHINPHSCTEARCMPNHQKYHDPIDEEDDTIGKPFQCTHCNKRFARKFNLNLHLRTHTGEKPFECSYCSKKFAQKSNLYVHLRKHTGEKPYQCNQCDKVFGHKCNLYNHMRAHTGEKPFECYYCHKKFQGKRNLRVHLRSHNYSGESS
ncbi:zinc finger protein 23 [Exaiptasia diaphana]|uniref:C2H2-type domain-containing protein n=1 Tax=Exaiptasia diaphana TaxID=2652724 RepID=A0A913Y1V2_EXADI|nr:zinc finger protein 23 [Exaiptasia diaphana]KXJ23227.1 Zinc finger protein 182 [Exaiptasia diaphana]